jgi:general secretion pathway protein E
MVGEIRDSETAQISIQAALTGHSVFSTLHTNRAPSSITRLMDMGAEKFLISSSILGVVAQRLVRILCPACKKSIIVSSENVSDFGFTSGMEVFKAGSCDKCSHTGYSSRRAIAELFIMNDHIQTALKGEVDDAMLMQLALNSGMVSLSAQLRYMIKMGDTSIEEAIRIGISD